MAQFIPVAIAALSTAASASAQRNEAKGAEYEAEYKAEQEKIRAQDEAIERRERLLNALAMQNARVGAAGIKHTGSPSHVMGSDIEKFEYEDLRGRVLSGNRSQSLLAQGRNKASASRLGAGLSLISGAASAYEKYPG